MTPESDLEHMVGEELQSLRSLAGRASSVEFSVLGDDRYRLWYPSTGVTFEIDRLRREHNELVGELSVRCTLPGARTFDGSLSIADFNLSSARARLDRAKLLAQRANTSGVDWIGFVEEFCQRVLQADRIGQPAVDLRTLPRPTADDEFLVEGIPLFRRHPSVLFGDGGAAKSYLGLYLAGRLAERGVRVALFDWELAGEDHRDRLERLFWDGMPQITYARCERPLVHETDRLRRIVRESKIEYVFYDSVAFACDGPPESAEIAGRYFRAVRQIGPGSMHVAHISKGENSDQKPFGSAFWHNGARSTWFAKLVSDDPENEILNIGLFNRKVNLGRLRSPIGFKVSFAEERTTFRRSDVAESPDLAAKMTVSQRMVAVLRRGALSPVALAEETDSDIETLKRTARRHKKQFTFLADGRLALLEGRAT